MYENQIYASAQKEAAIPCGTLGGIATTNQNPTVEENIDMKIAMLQAEILRLQESKKTLAPLLGMKIRDIREAMNY